MKYKIIITITAFAFLISSCSGGKPKKDNNSIPIFNNELLITKGNSKESLIVQKKWGVIDKNGNQVIPFICDGIKALSDSIGIASVYSGSYSLHTGVPRYVYCGKYFLFTRKGRVNTKEKKFSIVIEYKADFHNENLILETPNRFLPSDTISDNSNCDNLIFSGGLK